MYRGDGEISEEMLDDVECPLTASSNFFPIATQPIPYKDYAADSYELSKRCSLSLVPLP